jgi:DNA repair protein RecO (recombination protein O)
MTQTLKSEALVLHSMRWSESSKIIQLFTAERGLLKVIARGVMRPKSSFRGVLESLNHVEIVVGIKDTRDLQIVTQAELMNSFSQMRENLDNTAMAYAIAELLRKFIHQNEASHPIFRFTIQTLEVLNQSILRHPLILLIRYILYLSEYLGFGWNMESCRNCGKLPEKFPIGTDLVNGAIVCGNCIHGSELSGYRLSRLQWRLCYRLQQMIPAEVPELIQKIPEDLVYQPVLDLLISHLNYHTDQSFQLKSLKMFLP